MNTTFSDKRDKEKEEKREIRKHNVSIMSALEGFVDVEILHTPAGRGNPATISEKNASSILARPDRPTGSLFQMVKFA